MRSSLPNRTLRRLRWPVTVLGLAVATMVWWALDEGEKGDQGIGVDERAHVSRPSGDRKWRVRKQLSYGFLELPVSLAAGERAGDCVWRSERDAELAATVPLEQVAKRLDQLSIEQLEESIYARALLARWSEWNPRAAVAWANQLPGDARGLKGVIAEEGSARTLAEVAIQWAEIDGLQAAIVAAEEIHDGHELRRAVPGIVERWAARDADAASSWVDAFPPSELRELAVAHLRWMRQGTPPPPAGLPGEDFEDRTAVSRTRTTPTETIHENH